MLPVASESGMSRDRLSFPAFSSIRMILNGNGKLPWELELAVSNGVLVNIDSEFDFANIVAAAKKVGKVARVLLRINPNVDPQVDVSPA